VSKMIGAQIGLAPAKQNDHLLHSHYDKMRWNVAGGTEPPSKTAQLGRC
jgi:hypothetical protein